VKGQRLPTFKAVLADPKTVWVPITVTDWYGGKPRKLEIVSDTAVWYNSGLPPASIRWVLVRDPTGEREPQAFLSTDLAAKPEQILQWFVSRWRMETTFQEAHPPRPGNTAAVVRSRDPAHDAGVARVVLLDHNLGRSFGSYPNRYCRSTNRCLVCQVRADL
jgi:hypothetical protein